MGAVMPEWQTPQFHQLPEKQAQQFLEQQPQKNQRPPQLQKHELRQPHLNQQLNLRHETPGLHHTVHTPAHLGCPGVVMGAVDSEDFVEPWLHASASDLRTCSAPHLMGYLQGMVMMCASNAVTHNHTAVSPCLSTAPVWPMGSCAPGSCGLPSQARPTCVTWGSLAYREQAMHMNGQEASSVLKVPESAEGHVRGNPQHIGTHQGVRDAAWSDCVTTQYQLAHSLKSTDAVSDEARSAEASRLSRENIVKKIEVLNLQANLFSDSKQQPAWDHNSSENVSCTQSASVSLNVTGNSSPTSGIHRFAWTVEARKVRGDDSQTISPPFKLGGTSTSFKMMILPKVSYHGKGGASFQKAKGKGLVQLKRWKSEDPAPETSRNALKFWISIGNAEKRGPVEHNFTGCAVAGLPECDELWDFSKAIDEMTQTFIVHLDVLPGNA